MTPSRPTALPAGRAPPGRTSDRPSARDRRLAKLGLDYVDPCLIHWPTPARDLCRESWRALERLAREGRIRAAGVSDFQPAHLERLLKDAEREIAAEAWSPLAQGAVLDHPVIDGLAARYGRSPAQIVLRRHLQLGNVVIPESVTPARIREDFDVFGFELTDEEMRALAGLDRGRRTGPHPDELN